MAEVDRTRNFLGVEIRESLVDEANRLAAEAGLENLHYSFCNAMLWLGELLKEIPNGLIKTVTIQFPDPWFKKRHAKRRMVTPELVDAIIEKFGPAAIIFVQTDIEVLAEEMFGICRSDLRLTENLISENPFEVKTERELAVEAKGLPIYRSSFKVGKNWRIKILTSSSSLS